MSKISQGDAAHDAATVIRMRRTIHLFRAERPPDVVIEEALELARWAPNHRLTEPWRVYLLGEKTGLALAELNASLVATERGAAAAQIKLERWRHIPGWLLVTCRQSENQVRSLEDYAACCCFIQNMLLALWQHGIGAKWSTGGVTRSDALPGLLQIDPRAERIVGLFSYGYPIEIPRSVRNPVSDFLERRP